MSELIAGRIGEIVEATTAAFTARCHELYVAPALGTLVRAGGNNPVLGIVAEVRTQSLDPSRRPIAMGVDEETEEAVYEHNPQLNRLLSTEFQAIVVGYESESGLKRHLSPFPPRIHSFVYECGRDRLREFSSSYEFLPSLLNSPIGPQDELIAAFLRYSSLTQEDAQAYLVGAGKALAPLLIGQIQRLNNILIRLIS